MQSRLTASVGRVVDWGVGIWLRVRRRSPWYARIALGTLAAGVALIGLSRAWDLIIPLVVDWYWTRTGTKIQISESDPMLPYVGAGLVSLSILYSVTVLLLTNSDGFSVADLEFHINGTPLATGSVTPSVDVLQGSPDNEELLSLQVRNRGQALQPNRLGVSLYIKEGILHWPHGRPLVSDQPGYDQLCLDTLIGGMPAGGVVTTPVTFRIVRDTDQAVEAALRASSGTETLDYRFLLRFAPNPHLHQARSLLNRRILTEANEQAICAVERRPGSVEAHLLLIEANIEQGDLQAALYAAQAAFRLDPNDDELHKLFVHREYLERATGQWEAVLRTIDAALARFGTSHSGHYFLRQRHTALSRLGRRGEAVQAAQDREDVEWACSSCQTSFAMAWFSQKEHQQALRSARRAIELDSEDAGAHSLVARIHADAGHHTDALEAWETALQKSDTFELRHGKYLALWNLGRIEEAVDNMSQFAERSPHDADAWHTLATTYLRLGRNEDALMAFRRELDAAPDRYYAHLALGFLFYASRRDSEALEHARMAERLASDKTGPALLRFELHARAGESTSALRVLDAIARRPQAADMSQDGNDGANEVEALAAANFTEALGYTRGLQDLDTTREILGRLEREGHGANRFLQAYRRVLTEAMTSPTYTRPKWWPSAN